VLLGSRFSLVFLLGAFALAPSVASAAKPAKAPKMVDTKPIVARLVSGAPPSVAAGLAEVKTAGAGAADARPKVEGLLQKGLPPALAVEAIDALAAIGDPASSALLRSYVAHRNADVRHAAVRALVSTKGPEATAAFQEGLRSSDREVRGLSATGLGRVGATEAIPTLLDALDRGIAEAGWAVGKLCKQSECDKLLERTGKIPFETLVSGVDPIVFRSPAFPDEYVIGVLKRIRNLGSPEAKRYLRGLLEKWPKAGSKLVKREIEAFIPTIVDPQ